jgi:hypothetical protein
MRAGMRRRQDRLLRLDIPSPIQRDKGVREMKTITGIVLTGLSLVFAGCNSENGHDQAVDKAAKTHAVAEGTPTGVDNSRPQYDTTGNQAAGPQFDNPVNQAAAKAQGAVATFQYTVDKATVDARAVTNDAARSAASVTADATRTAAQADKLTNDAAKTGQDVLDNAKRDLNIFNNAVR